MRLLQTVHFREAKAIELAQMSLWFDENIARQRDMSKTEGLRMPFVDT